MLTVNIQQQTNITELLPIIKEGKKIILTQDNIPIARFSPIKQNFRKEGLHPGSMEISEDFDEPLSETILIEPI